MLIPVILSCTVHHFGFYYYHVFINHNLILLSVLTVFVKNTNIITYLLLCQSVLYAPVKEGVAAVFSDINVSSILLAVFYHVPLTSQDGLWEGDVTMVNPCGVWLLHQPLQHLPHLFEGG